MMEMAHLIKEYKEVEVEVGAHRLTFPGPAVYWPQCDYCKCAIKTDRQNCENCGAPRT